MPPGCRTLAACLTIDVWSSLTTASSPLPPLWTSLSGAGLLPGAVAWLISYAPLSPAVPF